MKKISIYICIFTICTLFIGCGKSNTSQEIVELTPLPKGNTTNSDIHPLYEAFLQNEIHVENPYVEGTYLTVMDDEDYESEFENPEKKYALVDVNNDEEPELIFVISSSPSKLMYILGICNNELTCFDVFETHTKSISFGVYDYGFVWKCENYDKYTMTYYGYNAEGQPSQARVLTEGDEATIAAHEGEEPDWESVNHSSN